MSRLIAQRDNIILALADAARFVEFSLRVGRSDSRHHAKNLGIGGENFIWTDSDEWACPNIRFSISCFREEVQANRILRPSL